MNTPTTDAELVRRYAEENSEPAFAELVERHVGFVYACALRRVGGDAHLARDVTQQVFLALARHARGLTGHAVLSGWLYVTTKNATAQVVRSERRRQLREQKAHAMNELEPASGANPDWTQLRDVLDEGLDTLGDDDRQAVLLRFFENRSFAEIGAVLRVAENTARMRVERALEKLHAALQRRGVTSTAAALGIALARQPAVAVPGGLAAGVAGAALAGAGLGTSAGGFAAAKAGLGFAAMVALAVTGCTAWSQHQTQLALQAEIGELRAATAAAGALRIENDRLRNAAAEVESFRGDDAELERLAAEATALRQRQQSWVQAIRPPPSSASATVFISGKINNPGKISPADLSRPMTLRQALEQAGGVTRSGMRNQIKITRTLPDGTNTTFVKDAEKDGAFVLQPDDVIYVPERVI